MKNKVNLFSSNILLFLVIEVYFFSLRIIGSSIYEINSNQQGILAVIVVFILLVLLVINKVHLNNLLFKRYICVFLIIYLLEFIYSTMKYGQGAGNVFVASNYCLIITMYFCLVHYFRQNGIACFNKWIVYIALINMLLHLGQYVLFDRGVVFLFFDAENLRMGSLRLSHATCAIDFLGIIIAFSEILSNKTKNTINYIVLLLGIVSFVYVSRGRASLIGAFVTCVGMLCYKNKKNALKIILIGLVVLFAGFVFLNYTSLGNSYLDSLGEEDTLSYRFTEMNYYIEQVKDNMVLGVGFIRRMGFTSITQIITGPRYNYSRTDVGIVGFINTFGIVGLVWYVAYLIRITKYVFRIRKHNTTNLSLIIIGIYIWNIVYLPTQMLFGVFSICIQAILLAYIDYYYNNAIQKEKQE